MSQWKSFGLAIFAAVGLLGETASSARAQCSIAGNPCATEWSHGSAINIGGLPGSNESQAYGINDRGQAVGYSDVGGLDYPTEWRHGSVIDLGRLSDSAESIAFSINDAGQAVGFSTGNSIRYQEATEWNHGSVIGLGVLPVPGFNSSVASAINNAGQVVGQSSCRSVVCSGPIGLATEWSSGKIIDLGGLSPPSPTDFLQSSVANSINDVGQVVGASTIGVLNVGFTEIATEWSDGKVINLGGLAGSNESQAYGINDRGQAVGFSVVGGVEYATEWSNGSVIDLGPGVAEAINDAGQVVGLNGLGSNVGFATEWSFGSVINLGPGEANGINDLGQIVGVSSGPFPVPELSTWAMLLLGFAGLGYVGYRQAKRARP
jgi:probable HAF family extracellular repeat protein